MDVVVLVVKQNEDRARRVGARHDAPVTLQTIPLGLATVRTTRLDGGPRLTLRPSPEPLQSECVRTLGIIGGIGPPSTIEYYRHVIEIHRRRTGGRDPRIIINSIDGAECWKLVSSDRQEALTEYLLTEIRKLAAAGADLGVLASNTVHIVFDELSAVAPIRLISIVEAASEAAAGLARVGLFATRPTTRGDFYRAVFARRGIVVVAPTDDEQELIHTRYMDELVNGQFLAETRERLLEVADRMRSEDNVQGIILGGTELPLLLRDEWWRGLRFLDTTRIHAEAAVAQILA